MKLGFIGLGNMATAMIGGLIENNMATPADIFGSAHTKASVENIVSKYEITGCDDNLSVVRSSDVIIVAVKPQMYEEVLSEIKGEVTGDKIIVSIAPGKSLEWLAGILGDNVKIVRCMPNTPALVGEGCTGVCRNGNITDKDMDLVMQILSSFGKAYEVKESAMDAVVAVSGSSPAYVFIFIEAMADAAVAAGLPRSEAYKFAAQAVYGSAKMVLETGRHPADLKDMVCSPAGTTIEAVRVLEEKGLRGAVMDAMKACADKSRSM